MPAVTFAEPPVSAAWRHRDARAGFEVVFLRRTESGYRVEGHTTAVEEGAAWTFGYTIALDHTWGTRGAAVVCLEQRYVRVEDDASRQRFDYEAPALDFRTRLVYDEARLVLDYPGIAVRVPTVD